MLEDLWGFEQSAGNKSVWDAYKRGVYWVSGVLGRVKESRMKIARRGYTNYADWKHTLHVAQSRSVFHHDKTVLQDVTL
jgi:hypothetical protein